MCARNAPIWIAALEPAQHVLLPGRIEHDRGERDHEIAQRAPGMARLQGFTGRGHGGAVCIDRERAAERDVARCRRGNHAEAIWLERREQRLQRDARLGGDARRTCRRVDGDGRQRLRRIEQHEVRGAGARVQRQRRPVVHVAARAYPVAVRARPVDGRDDVVGGAARRSIRPARRSRRSSSGTPACKAGCRPGSRAACRRPSARVPRSGRAVSSR